MFRERRAFCREISKKILKEWANKTQVYVILNRMVHVVGTTSHNVKMYFHNHRKQFLTVMVRFVGRYSSAGVATCYGLDESLLGARFSASVLTGPGAHPASYTMGTGSFLGVKRPGWGVDHPPPSCAEFKERVELYLYSTSGPSWLVLRWTLPGQV
jgi:hypothetical protein